MCGKVDGWNGRCVARRRGRVDRWRGCAVNLIALPQPRQLESKTRVMVKSVMGSAYGSALSMIKCDLRRS